jgi:beta-1,4-mannosyl-glycoprotein beta-1,4-N-acetylglucosaminyltransferase
MYFDEDTILDLRLNYLNEFVDQFIIVESKFTHRGDRRELLFNIDKYSKFKDKITYLIVDHEPSGLQTINSDDDESTLSEKYILNAFKRENYQREIAKRCLDVAQEEDVIIINDIDEIPNLDAININNIKNKLIIFKQKTYYYKFNLQYENLVWHGSKACKKKFFISPQWLRNTKHRKYPFWRIDIIFSKKKYNNIYYVEKGGWHFTNIKSPEDLEKKFLNFLHHQDFEASGLKLEDIKEKVRNKKILYDLGIDRRDYKWSGSKTLNKVSLSEMPDYLSYNYKKYSNWIEN